MRWERPRSLASVFAAVAVVGCVLTFAASAKASNLVYDACTNDGAENILGEGNWGFGFTIGTPVCPWETGTGGYAQNGIWITGNGNAGSGSYAQWQADAPSNITLNSADVSNWTYYTQSASAAYGAFFYYQGGNSGYLTSTQNPATAQGPLSIGFVNGDSSYFGFELACNAQTECGNQAFFNVGNIQLYATESTGPGLDAIGSSNLWNQAGHWTRGAGFPIVLGAWDSSGVCQAKVTWDGSTQAAPEQPTTPDNEHWNQCDPGAAPGTLQSFFTNDTIDTTSVAPTSARGVPLQIGAVNAAGVWTAYTESLNVDNVSPQLTLSGPTTASSTAGTQYVTATATAGPSGVGAIDCSADGSPRNALHLSGTGTEHAIGEIPVSGLGEHSISCLATNRSYDANGQPASTATANRSLRIGEPVSAGISFGRVIAHCRRVVKPVKVPGQWVTVRRHRKWVRVHRGARTRREHVLACHLVTPDRHVARVAYRHHLTVSGSLSAHGIALSHVPVRIIAAPDNGHRNWRTVDVVTTSADGEWTARLRPGPSRLIEAVYDGGPTTLPATSRRATALVPAKIVLTSVTQHVPWGGAIVINGRLLGGYIPGKGQQLLQVLDGVGKHLQLLANPIVRPSGRFTMVLLAHGGGGLLRTQIAVATLTERDYPFARAVSPRVWVTVA